MDGGTCTFQHYGFMGDFSDLTSDGFYNINQ